MIKSLCFTYFVGHHQNIECLSVCSLELTCEMAGGVCAKVSCCALDYFIHTWAANCSSQEDVCCFSQEDCDWRRRYTGQTQIRLMFREIECTLEAKLLYETTETSIVQGTLPLQLNG